MLLIIIIILIALFGSLFRLPFRGYRGRHIHHNNWDMFRHMGGHHHNHFSGGFGGHNFGGSGFTGRSGGSFSGRGSSGSHKF